MNRYDFSSTLAFQLDVAFDLVAVAVLVLALATAIGSVLVRASLDDHDGVLAWTAAPGFGLAALIAVADWPARLLGLPAAFAVLVGLGLLATGWLRTANSVKLPHRVVWLIAAGALVLSLPPLGFLFPSFDGDAMYFGRGIYDHLKTAVIDTMAREGMPPHTPYVSLDGAAVALNYYYGWHLLAAICRQVPGISSLGADLGLTVATAMAVFAAIMGVAWRLRPRISTVVVAIGLLATCSTAPFWTAVLPGAVKALLISKGHPIESVMAQASWVPQHLASGLFVVLALMLAGSLLEAPRERVVARALVLGVLVAAGVMSSAWTGGASLLATAFFALPVLLIQSVQRAALLEALRGLLGGMAVALMLAGGYIFYLKGLSSQAAQAVAYLGVGIYQTSDVLLPDTAVGALFNVVNYLTLFALVHLGAIYPAGLYGLYGRREMLQAAGLGGFGRLARVWVPAAMLAMCLLKSRLVHNDHSWRGVLVPVIVLSMLAPAVLAELLDRVRSGPTTGLNKMLAAGALGLWLASLWGLHAWHNVIILAQPGQAARVQHERMLTAGRVWQRVQALTADGDIVMAGPAAFDKATKPGGNVAWALFGDRRLLLTDYEWGVIFAHHVSEPHVDALDKLQTAFFAGGVTADVLQRLATRERVRAIVVAPGDAIAGTSLLGQGGHFVLAERIGGFEIHLRRGP